MRTRIYVDGKMKADLPENVQMDKFLPILKIFMFEGGWKHIEIKQEKDENV